MGLLKKHWKPTPAATQPDFNPKPAPVPAPAGIDLFTALPAVPDWHKEDGVNWSLSQPLGNLVAAGKWRPLDPFTEAGEAILILSQASLHVQGWRNNNDLRHPGNAYYNGVKEGREVEANQKAAQIVWASLSPRAKREVVESLFEVHEETPARGNAAALFQNLGISALEIRQAFSKTSFPNRGEVLSGGAAVPQPEQRQSL